MAEDSAEDVRSLPVRGDALVTIQRREMRAEAVDICAHGVCLTLPCALEVGTACQLDLQIPGVPTRSTSVVARVCFCLQGNNGYRIGLNCALDEFVATPLPDHSPMRSASTRSR